MVHLYLVYLYLVTLPYMVYKHDNVQVFLMCILEVTNEVRYHTMCTIPYTHKCILMINITLIIGGIHHIVSEFCTNSRALVASVVTVSSSWAWFTLASVPATMASKRIVILIITGRVACRFFRGFCCIKSEILNLRYHSITHFSMFVLLRDEKVPEKVKSKGYE